MSEEPWTRTAAGAGAWLRVTRAAWFPDLTLAPRYTRQRTSDNRPEHAQGTASSQTFNTFTIPVEASWELDLWGRVRRQVEAAQGRLAATVEDREAARLAIQAEVAIDYFALRSMEAELNLLGRSNEAFRRSLELTQNRRRGGVGAG